MNNINKAKFSCLRDGSTIRGYEYRPQGERLPIAIVSHGFMANLMTVKHYVEEAESVYLEREQGSVKLHFIEGGKHMFSKKHDKIAIEYLERFVRMLIDKIQFVGILLKEG